MISTGALGEQQLLQHQDEAPSAAEMFHNGAHRKTYVLNAYHVQIYLFTKGTSKVINRKLCTCSPSGSGLLERRKENLWSSRDLHPERNLGHTSLCRHNGLERSNSARKTWLHSTGCCKTFKINLYSSTMAMGNNHRFVLHLQLLGASGTVRDIIRA